MRLDKFLVHMGVGSRKEVKEYIKRKDVLVNQVVAKKSDQQIDENHDEIVFQGERLVYQEYHYIMLHKPAGVITATEDKHDKTVLDIIDVAYKGLFPVGRLDKDTEGLLLLTTNGELAHKLLSPKKHVDKKYFVTLEKPFDQATVALFEQGVVLSDGYQCMPARIVTNDANNHNVHIIIQEGKFHQVKRMFQATGNAVVYLKRETMGVLELDPTLPKGAYRPLTQVEIERLQNSVV